MATVVSLSSIIWSLRDKPVSSDYTFNYSPKAICNRCLVYSPICFSLFEKGTEKSILCTQCISSFCEEKNCNLRTKKETYFVTWKLKTPLEFTAANTMDDVVNKIKSLCSFVIYDRKFYYTNPNLAFKRKMISDDQVYLHASTMGDVEITINKVTH
jgi:hypothetical protein